MLFLLVASTYGSTVVASVSLRIVSSTTTVYVEPDYVSEPVGATFTIAVKISEVTRLYGFDVQFGWDPAILHCLDHVVKVPVEDYPDGVLHESVMKLKDVVDETGIPGAEPGALAWFGYSSMYPASSFNGSGIIFEMTFEVKDAGSCPLEIVSSMLSTDEPGPIEHEVISGYFSNVVEVHDVAVIDVSPSPTTVTVGDSVSIDVAVENQGTETETFDVTVYYDDAVIDSMTDVSLGSGDGDVLSFSWNTTGVTPESYLISAEASIVEGEDDVEDNFREDGKVEVTEAPPPQYELTISATDGGTTDPASGTYLYDEGTLANVTAYPSVCYKLDYWELDGDDVGSENPYSVLMDDDHTLHAVFIYVGYVETPVEVEGETYIITTRTNITLTDVTADRTALSFTVSGPSGQTGYIDTTIPLGLNRTKIEVFLDGEPVTPPPIITTNGTHYFIYFGFTLSTYDITIQYAIADVAVTDITPSPTTVTAGDPVSIAVTVENQGDFNETFDVTVYYDDTIIDSMTDEYLEAGATDVLSFTWETAGVFPETYVVSAEAILEGDVNIENNFGYAEVEVTEEIHPPPVGGLQVQWANYSTREYPCGDPRYPFGGKWHNGGYPVWKNFTVFNGADENIVYISVQYPEATPSFKPSKYMIHVIIPYPMCWTINVNLADRLIEFFAEDGGIPTGGCAIVSVEFMDGPTEEDCKDGHVFDVTVSLESCYAETFQLAEYIDKTPPNVEITFPDATSPGGQGYAFVKKKDGYIWVQTPDSSGAVKNIKWLWINGTASDCCSGVNRVEIWVNGTYMDDAELSGPIGSHTVYWSWHTDPTKDPAFWKDESWYYVIARAYDNSVNDGNSVMRGCLRVPKTNFQNTVKHWFFWIGVEGIHRVQLQDKPMWEGGKILEWVPGNGRVDVNGTTGFYPNGEVMIWLENKLYDAKIHLTTVTADNYGRFYAMIQHLPEVPRKPTCGDEWIIRAVDNKGNEGADHFAIIPWITYEDTMTQNDPKTWQTTKQGHVGDTIMVYGHGFLPSGQAKWNPYSTVYVEIVYTGVAPLSLNDYSYRQVFNGTSQFNWDNLEWYPRLSEVVLVKVTTDASGYWKAEITIPQSYGGLHAIYAREVKFETDIGMPGPDPTTFPLVRSGWPECTGIEKEAQAVIFDIWPTIEVFPSTAITDQYVTITGEGLPLPRYYELWMNGEPIVESRELCVVLDFGPYKQWIFENKRIRNNELDLSWAIGAWYPFSFCTPDPWEFPESPVWKGKLCSVTMDFEESFEEAYQFHIGSKYLKVPVLPADNYEVMIYYFDKDTDSYVYDRSVVTSVTVLKDPLNVDMEVGEIHFPSEIVDAFVRVDVDGIITDATALSLTLYKGETFIETLDHKNIGTGVYVATFDCPTEEGDYFLKVSVTKEYEFFTFYGSAIAGFTVNPTINGFNARLIELEGSVATLLTDVGQLKVDISEINGKVVDIEGKIATIETDIGPLRATASNINAIVIEIKDGIATIETDIGPLKTDVSNINAKIVNIRDNVATIATNMGMLNATLSGINAKIVGIEGSIVTIETNVGILKANISDIHARVVAIEGKVITIETDIATFEKSVESLNAAITSLNDKFITIQTDMGVLLAKLADINGIVTIENTVATIRTELGQIKGQVVDLEGDIAIIKTDIGTITTKADSIKSDVGLQPVTIGLSLIAALAAIAAAALILRKVYLK